MSNTREKITTIRLIIYEILRFLNEIFYPNWFDNCFLHGKKTLIQKLINNLYSSDELMHINRPRISKILKEISENRKLK